ncbi:hypothetical protein Tco_0164067 [Tanacetum coccineum]
MDDTYMTMEEYIKFKEEKARRRGRVFNWQTATYGNIRVDDDLYDLRSVEAEFLAIVIVDTVTPQDALPCKSQVSTPVNDEIDFRISFAESDDEDYTIIYMALPPHEQRHIFLRYEGLQYTDADIEDFESRLVRIYIRRRKEGGGKGRKFTPENLHYWKLTPLSEIECSGTKLCKDREFKDRGFFPKK